jgi:F-type H+-transporting ATPase subunit b
MLAPSALLDPGAADFWVLVSFVLFVALLVYYKVPGLVTKALDDRAAKIRAELDEARRLREEAQALLADYQKKAREAEDEAKAIVESAKKEAEALGAEARRALAEQLERRTRLAEEKIARAEALAVAEVRDAAVEKAVAAAESVLRNKATGDLGASLVDQSIRDLKSKLN